MFGLFFFGISSGRWRRLRESPTFFNDFSGVKWQLRILKSANTNIYIYICVCVDMKKDGIEGVNSWALYERWSWFSPFVDLEHPTFQRKPHQGGSWHSNVLWFAGVWLPAASSPSHTCPCCHKNPWDIFISNDRLWTEAAGWSSLSKKVFAR